MNAKRSSTAVTTYVVLLRGINVGGRNKLPMADLKKILGDLGCRDVATYIQSGNAVCNTRIADRGKFAAAVSSAISAVHGFAPQVLVLSLKEFSSAVSKNPYPDAEAENHVHLCLLESAPKKVDRAALDTLAAADERYELTQRVFYLHAPSGIHRSKLAAKVESLLNVTASSRNLRSARKILALARTCAEQCAK